MDRSSPSAAESASAVSAALDRRAAEMSADIYGLIVREIPQLHGDKRVLALLESSVAENVATVLHILQHDIDMEKVRAPAAAEEYARRLAQHGAPVAALLRAYRIGSARFEEWCLQELGRRTVNASIVSAAGMHIVGTLASYIDLVSEEVFSAYEAEKEKWLRNQSAARAARVRALLRNEQPDVAASEAVLGYRLRQYHLGMVIWITGALPGGGTLGLLERATGEVAAQAGCDGRLMFVPQDEASAWAWLPLGGRHDVALSEVKRQGHGRRGQDPVRVRRARARGGGLLPHPSAGGQRPGGGAGGRAGRPAGHRLRGGRAAGPDVRFARAAARLGCRDPRAAGGRRRPQRQAARHAARLPAGEREL
jgi:hypothetical protein